VKPAGSLGEGNQAETVIRPSFDPRAREGVGHSAKRRGPWRHLSHRIERRRICRWVHAGKDALWVSKHAGHSSVAFTLDRYGHLYEDRGDEAEALDALLAAARARLRYPSSARGLGGASSQDRGGGKWSGASVRDGRSHAARGLFQKYGTDVYPHPRNRGPLEGSPRGPYSAPAPSTSASRLFLPSKVYLAEVPFQVVGDDRLQFAHELVVSLDHSRWSSAHSMRSSMRRFRRWTSSFGSSR
jgi:hypothetical protein